MHFTNLLLTASPALASVLPPSGWQLPIDTDNPILPLSDRSNAMSDPTQRRSDTIKSDEGNRLSWTQEEFNQLWGSLAPEFRKFWVDNHNPSGPQKPCKMRVPDDQLPAVTQSYTTYAVRFSKFQHDPWGLPTPATWEDFTKTFQWCTTMLDLIRNSPPETGAGDKTGDDAGLHQTMDYLTVRYPEFKRWFYGNRRTCKSPYSGDALREVQEGWLQYAAYWNKHKFKNMTLAPTYEEWTMGLKPCTWRKRGLSEWEEAALGEFMHDLCKRNPLFEHWFYNNNRLCKYTSPGLVLFLLQKGWTEYTTYWNERLLDNELLPGTYKEFIKDRTPCEPSFPRVDIPQWYEGESNTSTPSASSSSLPASTTSSAPTATITPVKDEPDSESDSELFHDDIDGIITNHPASFWSEADDSTPTSSTPLDNDEEDFVPKDFDEYMGKLPAAFWNFFSWEQMCIAPHSDAELADIKDGIARYAGYMNKHHLEDPEVPSTYEGWTKGWTGPCKPKPTWAPEAMVKRSKPCTNATADHEGKNLSGTPPPAQFEGAASSSFAGSGPWWVVLTVCGLVVGGPLAF